MSQSFSITHNQTNIMEHSKVNRVRFNDDIAVHEIIHHSDFTEKEIMDTWYTNEETVHKLEQSLRISTNECRRGLENARSSKRRNHRQKRIKKAVLNVLNEQEQQKVFGYDDVEKIALVNEKDNDLSISKALELGLMDYKYIEENVICELNDDERQMLSNTKQMSVGHDRMELSITERPAFTTYGSKRPKCVDFENSLEINTCDQYEVELKSHTMDLMSWSVSLSINVVQ